MSTQGEIVRELKETIGHYRLYKAEGYEIEDDANYVAEEYMKKVVVETYGKTKDALEESLNSEAVNGKLSLQDLYEALKAVDVNADQVVIDYMLYYVYVRCLDTENLMVDTLIDMLNEAIKKQARAQSASRKSRPESSSPEKIKMRNVHKQAVNADENDDDEDNYSENIALDDGSGDDDIDKVEKNKKIDKSKAEPAKKDRDSDDSSNEDNRMLDINALGKDSDKDEDEDDEDYSDDNDQEKEETKKGLMR